MRDLERLQDVVEYRVSPGQIRIAFLGILAIACAIFAVGVSVGKRLEPGYAGVAIDPLDQIDRATRSGQHTEEPPEEETPALTYHHELTNHEATEPRRAQPGGEAPAEGEAAETQQEEQIQDEPPRPEEPAPGESSIYTLQVASYETREEAQQFANDLRSRGHSVFLVRTSTPDRGTWYRVRVGPFHSRREATRYQSRFEQQERLPTFLVQRRR